MRSIFSFESLMFYLPVGDFHLLSVLAEEIHSVQAL